MGTAGDWSGLPEDLLLIAMEAMEVTDVVRLGAVCSAWRCAYVTFRRLRLRTPNQPPCLLYAGDADAAVLYSLSTNATFRLPPLHSVVGSAHGLVFTTDEAANPYLLNPLTGARAALPPVTTLERVKSSFVDGEGNTVYNVDDAWTGGPKMKHVTSQEARNWMYGGVAISGAARGAAACTVLLVHMPHGELSFARPGDERWTPLPQLRWIYPGFATVVQDDEKSGLFYVLRSAGDLHALDLSGPSPVTWHVATTMRNHVPERTPYLIPTPCGRSLLLVTRSLFRSVEFPEDGDEKSSDGRDRRRCNAITTGISIETIGLNGRRLERPKGVVDSAMFLGRNSPIWLPVAHYPMLKRNCAYLVDDCQQTSLPIARRDHGIWDFESGSLHKPTAVWPHRHPWSDTPIPIWITPSLY